MMNADYRSYELFMYRKFLDDLGGIAEVAQALGVSPARLVNWRTRYANTFPQPVLIFAMGPVYCVSDVRSWHMAYEAGHYK